MCIRCSTGKVSLGLQHDVQPNSHPSWFSQSRNGLKRLEVLQQTKIQTYGSLLGGEEETNLFGGF